MSPTPASYRLTPMSPMSALSRPQDAKGPTKAPTSVADTVTSFQADTALLSVVAVTAEANELGDLEAADVEAQTRLAKLYKDYGVSSFLFSLSRTSQ